jgi:bifunctional N-acetylglucosamine-1-phosphate-uridyltransferase/glucosamine-1-phosphate-acetyltransferase GlmU-like protein
MKRLLIIPAAGKGSRLAMASPKVLVPVNGRPMISYLFQLYRAAVDKFIVVVNPASMNDVRDFSDSVGVDVEYAVQAVASGMLDAILVPLDRVKQLQPHTVWITWCDQIAVEPQTVATLQRVCESIPDGGIALPTITMAMPYIHFDRDSQEKIVAVRQRREGDDMPDLGEADMGLFSLSLHAYCDLLPKFRQCARPGAQSGERNFLPFIPWAGQQIQVQTFPGCHEIEAVGINTRDDLARIEKHLVSRHLPWSKTSNRTR